MGKAAQKRKKETNKGDMSIWNKLDIFLLISRSSRGGNHLEIASQKSIQSFFHFPSVGQIWS